MVTHSHQSKWMLILLVVVLLISACQPSPTAAPPATTQAPTEPPPTEPPPATTEAPTEPPATEPPAVPTATEKTFVEPVPVMVHEYGQGGEPSLCDPANPVLTPVGQLETQETESTILDGATAVFVEYVNENGQNFRITVHSSDPAVAKEYLATLALCLEAIEVGPPSGIEATSPPFDQFLRDAISEATGLSLEELQARRDEYIKAKVEAGETPSLRDFLKTIGADPDAVLNDALGRAGQAIDAARSAGLLTDEQVADLSARSQIEYEEEYADSTFSILAEEILAYSGNFADELKANSANIVIEPEWLDTLEQQNFMIFSVWDPPTISGVGSHWYIWKKNTYVDARLYVSAGKAGAYLYRWESYCRYLISSAKVAPGWTSLISGSSSVSMWYRLRVYGFYAGSNTYYLYGTWRGLSPTGSTSCGHP
ncbi:MAG TPA: hypothetical protein VFR47_05745 [Anaerolineales bacterium]|nr:hypothetical protein [Anaerolineales bacterium]